MTTDRIINQAKELDWFDEIISMTEKDIPEFIKKHKNFIISNKTGYGLWMWKPKIILDTMQKMKDNSILIYCDAGMFLNKNGIDKFNYYIDKLNGENISILSFSANDKYKAQYFVKNDAIMECYPDFNNELNNACYAGIIIIKKNIKSLNFINEWLNLCENYHYIDKSPSYIYKELQHFCGNDCDNGLFNLCLVKHKISYSIYPDETNVYTSNGLQMHHTNINPNCIDWSILDNFPFQCRRITPKFGFK
jgi:hypothetical protein